MSAKGELILALGKGKPKGEEGEAGEAEESPEEEQGALREAARAFLDAVKEDDAEAVVDTFGKLLDLMS